jgi:hypothetical protein
MGQKINPVGGLQGDNSVNGLIPIAVSGVSALLCPYFSASAKIQTLERVRVGFGNTHHL